MCHGPRNYFLHRSREGPSPLRLLLESLKKNTLSNTSLEKSFAAPSTLECSFYSLTRANPSSFTQYSPLSLSPAISPTLIILPLGRMMLYLFEDLFVLPKMGVEELGLSNVADDDWSVRRISCWFVSSQL